jgi:hypothetical protein
MNKNRGNFRALKEKDKVEKISVGRHMTEERQSGVRYKRSI